ncbi:MAG: hypothetical protein KatS3mg010_0118 [Acidimicrobiia bacterium]|nr:MAG: hypothetical protein KatS3mg010_0118 [Acidimicrobiia bacterium]
MVLLILAGLWAVVLVPPVLRAKRTERTGDSIGDFNYRLDVLSRTNGAGTRLHHRRVPPFSPVARGSGRVYASPVSTPSPSQRAAKRRRDILTVLVGGAAITFLGAYGLGIGAFWSLQLLFDVLLAVYLGLWVSVRSAQFERAVKVRYLPAPQTPELALRRTGSS